MRISIQAFILMSKRTAGPGSAAAARIVLLQRNSMNNSTVFYPEGIQHCRSQMRSSESWVYRSTWTCLLELRLRLFLWLMLVISAAPVCWDQNNLKQEGFVRHSDFTWIDLLVIFIHLNVSYRSNWLLQSITGFSLQLVLNAAQSDQEKTHQNIQVNNTCVLMFLIM